MIIVSSGTFAQHNFWKKETDANIKTQSVGQKLLVKPSAYKSFTLDTALLKGHLRHAPKTFSEAAKHLAPTMALPMPDGTFGNFAITETSVMEPALAAQFPEIKTYNGQGIDDPSATVKISWTYNGFYATIFSPTYGTIVISPITAGSKTAYMAYNLKDLPITPYTEQKIPSLLANLDGAKTMGTSGIAAQSTGATTQGAGAVVQGATAGSCTGSQLLTYRIEISCTGEYAQALGYQLGYGTAITKGQVFSDMVNKLNGINAIYEREVSISFTLVAQEGNVIFLDGTTDPYTDNYNASKLMDENIIVANKYIGTANYDLGIVLCSAQAGVAYIGVVCSSGKAGACSGYLNPTDPHYINSICHEMGHEFNCPHGFVCGNPGGVEPGTGVTIMSYAGSTNNVCTAVSDVGIPNFHTSSRNYIYDFVRNGAGSTCPVFTSTGNHVPMVSVAGTAYSIPLSTPFTMTGSATDADGDLLTYMWEEFDIGTTSNDWNMPTGSSPLFRDFAATTSPSRTFPQISDLATGISTPGEFLANYARDINLRLTVRDNRSGGGGVCSADAVVTVTNSAPFIVTSQNNGDTWVANGTNTQNITWNVASTNSAPINCASVDILFSIDGGYTYPYMLASGVPNNGSANIVVPSYNTPLGRVMVRSVGNVFFNVNAGNINVSISGCAAEGATLSPSVGVSAIPGSPSLNLSLQNLSTSIFSASGTHTLQDPPTSLVVMDSRGYCRNYTGDLAYYTAYDIIASKSGLYNFTLVGEGTIVNIYKDAFYSGTGCTNLIASNYMDNYSHNILVHLDEGQKYVVVSSWWYKTADPNFSLSVTGISPTGGNVYFYAPSSKIGLSPQNSSLLFSASGTYTSADLPTYLTVQNSSGGCVPYSGNPITCKPYEIMVSKTGSYTFSLTGGGNIVNVYNGSFNINNTCTNLLASSYQGANNANLVVNLNAGQKYVLVGEWWAPNLDPNFSIAVASTPTGGAVYFGSSIYTDPGTAYSYKYVIVNNATNNIVDIATTADLTDPTIYPSVNNYTVYGLSYSNAIAGSLGSYIGGAFSALTNQITSNPNTFCASLSKNSVPVQIISSVVVPPVLPVIPIFANNYLGTVAGLYTTMYAGSTIIGSGGSVQVNNGGNWVLMGNISSADKGFDNAPNNMGRTETVTFNGNGTYSGATTTPGAAGFVVNGYAASTASWTGLVLPIGNADAAYPITVPTNTAVTAAYFAGTGNTQSSSINGLATTEYSPYIDFPAGIPSGNYTISYPSGFNANYNSSLLSSANTSTSGTNSGTAYSLLSNVSNFASTAGTTNATLPSTAITQLYFSGSPVILPVTLVSFTGIAAGCTANLIWKTSLETNSSYYAIEVGTDGLTFNQVGKVASKNSLLGASYSYSYALNASTHYFRLKAVDNDGQYVYSSVVTLNGSGACGTSQQVFVSPNPAKNMINVTGLLVGSHLGLYDMGGKKMMETIATGSGQSINISMFASGIYMLHIQTIDGKSSYMKVVKQ